MKKLIQKIPFFIFFYFFLLANVQSTTQAENLPTLERIDFHSVSADEEQVTFKLNGIYIPKIFALKGEKPRVVFDFFETKPAVTINNILETKGNFIQRIRMGIHKDENPKTRIVFDLVPDKEIDFTQNFDQQANTLTVSVYRAGSKISLPEEKPVQPEAAAKPESPVISEDMKEVVPPDKTTGPFAVLEEQQPSEVEIPAKTDDRGTSAAQPSTPEMELPVGQPESAKEKSPVLYSVKFDNSSNRGEMIQFKLNDFYPPVVFGIEEGLPRVVCDFKDTRADSAIKETIKADGQYVKTIRVGRHKNPDKVRVVIDLEPNNNYDLQQVFFKEDNLFVLIVNSMYTSSSTKKSETPPNK